MATQIAPTPVLPFGREPNSYPISRQLAYRILLYLNIFRLSIAVLLLASIFKPELFNVPPILHINLARATVFVYLAFSLIFFYRLKHERGNPFPFATQAIISDLILGTLILHAIGGVNSGIGVLLVFVASTSALYLPPRSALLFASVAATAIVGEAFFAASMHDEAPRSLAQAGLFGVACLFGAAGGVALVQWNHRYQNLALQQTVDLANLEQINELIIRRMQTGVLVLDDQQNVRVMNESAWSLLGEPSYQERRLPDLSPALSAALDRWDQQETGAPGVEAIQLKPGRTSIIPRFASLPGNSSTGVLVFLEDAEFVAQRANDMTIGSLAQLSGGIAHEIRNPLAAVTHAAQLLAESDHFDDGDKKLLRIIDAHCHRMNDIVENILQLSRRERSRPEVIAIIPWLKELEKEVTESSLGQHIQLFFDPIPESPNILFDPGQLHQVFWKLLENAATHGAQEGRRPKVIISVHLPGLSQNCVVHIEDNGPGIPPAILGKLFEPFVSTSKKGSGLGLYLAKQLCEANLADISVESGIDQGTRFRIRLPMAHDRRRHSINEQDYL